MHTLIFSFSRSMMRQTSRPLSQADTTVSYSELKPILRASWENVQIWSGSWLTIMRY